MRGPRKNAVSGSLGTFRRGTKPGFLFFRSSKPRILSEKKKGRLCRRPSLPFLFRVSGIGNFRHVGLAEEFYRRSQNMKRDAARISDAPLGAGEQITTCRRREITSKPIRTEVSRDIYHISLCIFLPAFAIFFPLWKLPRPSGCLLYSC